MATALQPTDSAAAGKTSELSAMLSGAAIAPLDDRAFLRVTGPDASRWLNGMVTNDVQSLKPGEGCYNFLLNAQGRILGDCTIYRDPAASEPVFVLQTDKLQIDTIRQHLDKFIIMDEVELSDTAQFGGQAAKATALLGVVILGPKAHDVLASAMMTSNEFPLTEAPSAGNMVLGTHNGKHPAWVLAPPDAAVPTFEIWCSDPTDYKMLLAWLEQSGAAHISEAYREAFRILSGTPRYGVDIRNTEKDKDLPQETGQTRALHFSKGCYLGQEIVERIRSRGNVHRTFTGFSLTGELPAPGTVLELDGKPAGELTSVAAIPLTTPVQLALGYIRREALAAAQSRGITLNYPGGVATPIVLPYPVF
jgi:folate-binding protein YgfZ